MIMIAFKETHKWLTHRGLKTDQVKNKLMHYTKTKNRQASPPIHIPMNNHTVLKEVTPTNCMRYLGLWFNPQLRFHEHVKIVSSKASRATKALQMLGNSTSGINQLCLRQIYLGTVLPIATYGSVAFWDRKSSVIKNTLQCAQNKVLCFITGAFKTTPITVLEIEASIPPIDITLDYYTEHYATQTQKLNPSNPVMCCIPTQHRGNIPIQTTLPLPCLPPPLRNQVSAYLIRQHELKIKNTMMTRLIHMAKHITPDTECIDPHAELPWCRSKHNPDTQEWIHLYIPENKPGTSVKLEWAEDHASLYDEYKSDNNYMFVYTDGSLSYYNGVHRTGYGIAI